MATEVVEASDGNAVLAQPTTMLDVFSMAAGAAVMVSGDTGPLQIAAAVGTPVVALFGPTRSERNGPWLADDITVSRTERCSCLYKRKCRADSPCIEDIGVAEVSEAVRVRLERAARQIGPGRSDLWARGADVNLDQDLDARVD
jgi:ADP-heptose:LPS heptosyltransferase